MSRNSLPFVGRRSHEDALRQLLSGTQRKVVVLSGQSGVGKTSLANRVLASIPKDRFSRPPIRHLCLRPGIDRGVEDWLAVTTAKALDIDTKAVISRHGLEDEILRKITAEPIMICLDNAEYVDQCWLTEFAHRWCSCQSQSMLLIITTGGLNIVNQSQNAVVVYNLPGLDSGDTDAILSVMGRDLQDRFGSERLLSTSDLLDNIPQRLLYIRWLNPGDENALAAVESKLKEEEFPEEELWQKLRPRAAQLVHFFAIGYNRSLEFHSDLLAWLWDACGGGAANEYQDVREFLLSEGFISRVGGGTLDRFTIHPSLHIKLEKFLERTTGRAHIGYVVYHLSEYYRDRYAKSTVPDLDALYDFVFCASRATNVLSALRTMLEPVRLEDIHRRGLALGLRDILVVAKDALGREVVAGSPSDAEVLAALRGNLDVELARCECELSHYGAALELLRQAEEKTVHVESASERAMLRGKINYYRGIAYGCLGKEEESLRAYLAIVEHAIDAGTMDAMAVEALGYIALVEALREQALAEKLGDEALRLARNIAEPWLLARSLCSVGQVYFFGGKRHEAGMMFREAEGILTGDIASAEDVREYGRLLVAMGMECVAVGETGRAREIVRKAVEINGRIGERRRHTRAKALMAICLWLEGNQRSAADQLAAAVEEHAIIHDQFYGPMEALCYACFLGATRLREAIELARQPKHVQAAWSKILCGTDAERLERGWNMFVRPLLFSPSGRDGR